MNRTFATAIVAASFALTLTGCDAIQGAQDQFEETKAVIAVGQEATNCAQPVIGAVADLGSDDVKESLKSLSKEKLDQINTLISEVNTDVSDIASDLGSLVSGAAKGDLTVDDATVIKVDICTNSEAAEAKVEQINALINS